MRPSLLQCHKLCHAAAAALPPHLAGRNLARACGAGHGLRHQSWPPAAAAASLQGRTNLAIPRWARCARFLAATNSVAPLLACAQLGCKPSRHLSAVPPITIHELQTILSFMQVGPLVRWR